MLGHKWVVSKFNVSAARIQKPPWRVEKPIIPSREEFGGFNESEVRKTGVSGVVVVESTTDEELAQADRKARKTQVINRV